MCIRDRANTVTETRKGGARGPRISVRHCHLVTPEKSECEAGHVVRLSRKGRGRDQASRAHRRHSSHASHPTSKSLPCDRARKSNRSRHAYHEARGSQAWFDDSRSALQRAQTVWIAESNRPLNSASYNIPGGLAKKVPNRAPTCREQGKSPTFANA
eukprot:294235-Prymnesium_polylepis.2